MTDNVKGLETTIRTLKMQCAKYAQEISKDIKKIERLKKERDWWKKNLQKEIEASFYTTAAAEKRMRSLEKAMEKEIKEK